MIRNQFDSLRHGTPARLARLKANLAKSLATVEKNHGADSGLYRDYTEKGIRAVRYSSLLGDSYANYSPNYGGVYYAESGALDHLRTLPTDQQIRDYPLGWYCDDYQNETVTGLVAVLPSHRGSSLRRSRANVLKTDRTTEPRYLAYVKFSDADGITVDASYYTDPVAAQHAANRLAERIAEEQREDSAIQDEAYRLSEADTEARDAMKACRVKVASAHAILRELPAGSANRQTVTDCASAARRKFHRLLASIDGRAERLAELKAEGAEV